MLITAEQEYVLARQLKQNVAQGTPEAVQGSKDVLAAARRRLVEWQVPETELRRLEETGQPSHSVTLEAPTGGVVVEKNVLPGQRVMAGDALYRIADLGTVWLDGEVFERDLPAVHLGQPVTAEFQALPGQERRGRIAYIYPTLNPETRTARVRIALPNPGLELKPGMFGTIRFTAVTSQRALSVPRSAVFATGQRNLVFVRRPDGRFTPRDVVLGVATDERIEILGGLSAGETVVASGTFLVDAESNLSTLMGGMGNMPGMDVTAPGIGDTAKVTPLPDTGMAGMPGMATPKPKE
jgi:Cu(I)/Ag(I) efflux system membrane fusion protein